MTAEIPKVRVFLEDAQIINRPGMAGKIAVIGAFDSTETEPLLFTSLNDAYAELGTATTYKGCSCLDKLFYGAGSVLAVNITTKTGSGAEEVIDKTLTTQKLSAALAKIKGEDWDILFIAENITDEAIVIIDAYLDETFEMKYPAGYVAGLTRANASAYETTAGKIGTHSYGIITQQLSVNGVELSIEDSGAYYAGVIAGMNVGNSMTMKTVPNVTGLNPELSFETGGNGKALLEQGYTTLKCQDRGNGNYVVVNSEQPNGYDLYVNRTRDFVIKEMALHQFLGERNRTATLDEIKHEVDRVKEECVTTLDLLEDINYEVVKKDANCVDIYIDSLVFAGIITTIDVYVKVEVE